MSFSTIIFAATSDEGETTETVPTNWVSADRKKCYWVYGVKNMSNFVKHCSTPNPSNKNWRLFDILKHEGPFDYERAKRHERKLANGFTDGETTDAEDLGKLKRRRNENDRYTVNRYLEASPKKRKSHMTTEENDSQFVYNASDTGGAELQLVTNIPSLNSTKSKNDLYSSPSTSPSTSQVGTSNPGSRSSQRSHHSMPTTSQHSSRHNSPANSTFPQSSPATTKSPATHQGTVILQKDHSLDTSGAATRRSSMPICHDKLVRIPGDQINNSRFDSQSMYIATTTPLQRTTYSQPNSSSKSQKVNSKRLSYSSQPITSSLDSRTVRTSFYDDPAQNSQLANDQDFPDFINQQNSHGFFNNGGNNDLGESSIDNQQNIGLEDVTLSTIWSAILKMQSHLNNQMEIVNRIDRGLGRLKTELREMNTKCAKADRKQQLESLVVNPTSKVKLPIPSSEALEQLEQLVGQDSESADQLRVRIGGVSGSSPFHLATCIIRKMMEPELRVQWSWCGSNGDKGAFVKLKNIMFIITDIVGVTFPVLLHPNFDNLVKGGIQEALKQTNKLFKGTKNPTDVFKESPNSKQLASDENQVEENPISQKSSCSSPVILLKRPTRASTQKPPFDDPAMDNSLSSLESTINGDENDEDYRDDAGSEVLSD